MIWDPAAVVGTAVDFMEANLTADIDRYEVAHQVGFSPRYFHQLFSFVTGESVSMYLRKRRLTEAAKELRNDQCGVLDIARQYKYGSQEAFTRAFKEMFGITPGECRSINRQLVLEEEPLTPARIQRFRYPVQEPRIVVRAERNLVGMQWRCSIGEAMNQHRTADLWRRFMCKVAEISGIAGSPEFVGVYRGSRPHAGLSFDEPEYYMAAISVESNVSVPEAMARVSLPAATYAVFPNSSSGRTLQELTQYIIGTWFRRSGFEPDPVDCIQVFSGNPAQHPSNYETYIPVRQPRDDWACPGGLSTARFASPLRLPYPGSREESAEFELHHLTSLNNYLLEHGLKR